MKAPKMILFDYGQTLINEVWYTGAQEGPYEAKDGILTIRNWRELQEMLVGGNA